MRKLFLVGLGLLLTLQLHAQDYVPSASNLKQREWFNDARFGLFIHWGPFSIPGSGEWVMNERKLTVHNYTNLKDFFNPIDFNAQQWVSMAKNAGMKYITLITRHHDGFSMWDTKYSDFNIMNTPYKKDVVKMMADECHKQGIKLYLYYSLLDWRREDYPHQTGRTGQHSGRKGKGDYASYLQFMKNQLTELLTNYGEIGGIWFDGHWDQTAPEGAKDRKSRIDWKYNEIYDLIHKLQPQCMIGNNHHLTPFAGEDFQMFERDLPGENKSGLSFQKPSDQLPLETCETISNSWGYNLSDTTYKSEKKLINMLVRAASLGSNLLLNVGPMPNGKIQPEFQDRLAAMGNWLKTYGESIYNTNAGYVKPSDNWSMTQAGNKIYLHILDSKLTTVAFTPVGFKKIKKAYLLKGKAPVNYSLKKGLYQISTAFNNDEDNVVVLEVSE
ncbi:alpha-L-fucosidase [Pedobacter endophyticus]|uniref:alpha-L-fucosidase n=1 Tax=Pedobacter endophyticus TaxID=2789740 RepID=A0A7U3Q3L4_9SPHI|nr:alpha-L-fucosidase [Pedobacter endophyticus]QPH37929.1 alpha-L-fucosidase [Pedobacter endophyticus]